MFGPTQEFNGNVMSQTGSKTRWQIKTFPLFGKHKQNMEEKAHSLLFVMSVAMALVAAMNTLGEDGCSSIAAINRL